jgi:hypothetical protein
MFHTLLYGNVKEWCIMGLQSAKLSADGKSLTIVVDFDSEPYNTEKYLMYGTSHGYQATSIPVQVKGPEGRELKVPLRIMVNVGVPDPCYKKPPKALN